jgi:hypothetical protein
VNWDRVVTWTLLIVVIGVWVAAAFGGFGRGFMTLIVPVVVTLIAAFLGAWQLDRRNRHINVSSHFDENRGTFDVPMNNNQRWQIPTAYIDHKTGSGAPPGVEPYDVGAVDAAMDENHTRPASEDPAP